MLFMRMHKRLMLLWSMMYLSACTGSSSTPPAEGVGAEGSEEPLLTTQDLDSAAPLPSSAELTAAQADARVDLPIPIRRPDRAAFSRGASDLSEDLEEAFTPRGKLAYVQKFELGRYFRQYWLRLATVRDFQLPGRLIYRGERAIDSVAVSVDGGLVTFAAESDDGDFDVFLLDVDGSLAGTAGEVFTLPSTDQDELHVSMALDGATHAWQTFDPESGTTDHVVARLDRSTGEIETGNVSITVGGQPLEQRQPSLDGSGSNVYFAADGPAAIAVFDAPIIVSFATDGSGGSVVYAGAPGATTALSNPSASFAGERIMFQEVFDARAAVVILTPALGELGLLFEGEEIDHPFITADGMTFTYAQEGLIYKANILDNGDTVAADSTPLIDLPPPFFFSTSPYWAKELPPPPPPPPGTVICEGTTVGGPEFARPEGTGPGLIDGLVAYDLCPFTTEERGFYTVLSEQDYDGYIHVYRAPFDPNQPLENVLVANDDFGDNRKSRVRLLLEANTEYVVVVSAYEPGDAGTYTNTITPPQIPEAGEPPVIEEFAESVRVAEPGTPITYELFAVSADPISCQIDFGDGTTEPLPCESAEFVTATHAWDQPGFYVVTVSVTNSAGTVVEKAFPTIAIDDPNRFNIVVVFGNDQLSDSQRAAFQIAADRWSEVIVGDLAALSSGSAELPADFSCNGEPPFNGFVDDLVVSAVGEPIDGPGSVLGSAGPCLLRADGSNGERLPLPTYGVMRFDLADLADLENEGGLDAVILHEMGHVLGIGSLWAGNGFLTGTVAEGADPNSEEYDPRYTAPLGVEEYIALRTAASLPLEDSVPAANTGGGGTRESHWREATFVNELMTGYLSEGINPLSMLTIADLADLGYTVDYAAADPYALPASTQNLAPRLVHGHDIVLTPAKLSTKSTR